MPTANYSSPDLTNIVATLGPTYTNSSDIGTPPLNTNASGSVVVADATEADVGSRSYLTIARGEWLADVDHASPVSPIPIGARIKSINIRETYTSNPQTSSLNLSLAPFGATKTTTVVSQIIAQMFPQPLNILWQSDYDEINVFNFTNSTSLTPNITISANPLGAFIGATYDFTINPNGDFPLGYMTYADFITNFSQIKFVHYVYGQCTINFGASHGNITSGSLSANCFARLTTWTMDVLWETPYSWTVNQNGPNLEINSNGLAPNLTTVDAIAIIYGNKKLTISDPPTTPTEIIVPIPTTCTPLNTATILGVIAGVEYEIDTIVIV